MTSRPLLLLIVAALVLVACGGAEENGSVMFDAAGPADSSVASAEARSDRQAPATEVDGAAATAAYEQFLLAQNRFRIEDRELTSWREEQWAIEKDLDAEITARTSTANINTVSGNADELVLHDCLEVEETNDWLNSDEFPVDLTGAGLIDQLVTMVRTGEGWTVDAIDVRHSGGFGSTGLGCVPPRHVPRVIASVERILSLVADTYRSPNDGVPVELGDALFDELAEVVTATSELLVERDWYFEGEEERTIEVVGSSPRHGNRSFLVGVCTRYPGGYQPRLVTTGEIAEVDLDSPIQGPPGRIVLTGLGFVRSHGPALTESIDGGLDPKTPGDKRGLNGLRSLERQFVVVPLTTERVAVAIDLDRLGGISQSGDHLVDDLVGLRPEVGVVEIEE